jgi:hypothetical protein
MAILAGDNDAEEDGIVLSPATLHANERRKHGQEKSLSATPGTASASSAFAALTHSRMQRARIEIDHLRTLREELSKNERTRQATVDVRIIAAQRLFTAAPARRQK